MDKWIDKYIDKYWMIVWNTILCMTLIINWVIENICNIVTCSTLHKVLLKNSYSISKLKTSSNYIDIQIHEFWCAYAYVNFWYAYQYVHKSSYKQIYHYTKQNSFLNLLELVIQKYWFLTFISFHERHYYV